MPTVEHLKKPEIQAAIVKAVEEQRQPAQLELEGVAEKPDIAAVVAKTVELVAQQTIDIPRILVVPKGEVKSGFKPFTLELRCAASIRPCPRSSGFSTCAPDQLEVVALGRGGIEEARLEDYVVSGLVDFDDVSYDDHADLLYDLAAQTVQHLQSYLSEERRARCCAATSATIARFIHAQMQEHYWEDAAGYEVKISKGFTELKPSAYTALGRGADRRLPASRPRTRATWRSTCSAASSAASTRCRSSQSDAERKLAVILEREALKWFKPAKGQFQIFYRQGADHLEYQPDFVAETADTIYMLEPKAANQMDDPIVLAKKEAAVKLVRERLGARQRPTAESRGSTC